MAYLSSTGCKVFNFETFPKLSVCQIECSKNIVQERITFRLEINGIIPLTFHICYKSTCTLFSLCPSSVITGSGLLTGKTRDIYKSR